MSLWLTHPLFIPSMVVGITILLWATSLLPEFITALLFFAVAMVAKIAPPDVIFGGFASSAFWLVFSGFVLGIAIRKTGLAAAVITLLPRVGFINGDEFSTGVNIRTCIYVAGILGLAITVTQTGIGSAVGEALLQVMPLDAEKPFTSFLALTGITTALNFIMTANGVPALYTTLAQSFADAAGFPLLSVIMIQVLGYSTPLLPYQASPIVVAMALGKVPARAGMLLCIALAAATYLILLPLDYAWFTVLGKL